MLPVHCALVVHVELHPGGVVGVGVGAGVPVEGGAVGVPVGVGVGDGVGVDPWITSENEHVEPAPPVGVTVAVLPMVPVALGFIDTRYFAVVPVFDIVQVTLLFEDVY